jgi:hypothetical protein
LLIYGRAASVRVSGLRFVRVLRLCMVRCRAALARMRIERGRAPQRRIIRNPPGAVLQFSEPCAAGFFYTV